MTLNANRPYMVEKCTKNRQFFLFWLIDLISEFAAKLCLISLLAAFWRPKSKKIAGEQCVSKGYFFP